MKEKEILSALGVRIKTFRLKKNMNQTELAIECNFEKATMSRIETGQTNLTVRTLNIISKALDIPISELLKE